MDTFRTFYDFNSLKAHITEKSRGSSIGLVPTMGALHEGHASLVKKASVDNDIVVVTIFVNPKQFNNPSDLELYPRTIDKDLALLSKYNNILVCIPNEKDVYPKNDPYSRVELGALNKVLEGRYRPGHFDGVAHVVHNLFYFIKPTRAYFGLKDYQQFAVIKKMVELTGLDVGVFGCDTVRDKNGLALSSRNQNLSTNQLEESLVIINTLKFVKENCLLYPIEEVRSQAIKLFKEGSLTLEYLDIVNIETFNKVSVIKEKSVCCIAAYCNKVRLIDNILL